MAACECLRLDATQVKSRGLAREGDDQNQGSGLEEDCLIDFDQKLGRLPDQRDAI